jgi:hypothetical protein
LHFRELSYIAYHVFSYPDLRRLRRVGIARHQEKATMAELLLYQRPVRLNRFAHAKVRFSPLKSFAFCRKVTSVPLIGVEFPPASRHYPIVFVQAADGTIAALAVLSFRVGENAFVDEEGRWMATYVPAFVRRYPFVLADIPGNPADYDVAMDEASECFSTDKGEPLFSPLGEPEPFLRSQIEFLRAFQQEYRRTQEFLQAVQSAGLLATQNVDVVRADRERFGVRNTLVVDEQKLLALPTATAKAFLAAGYLGWIYAHLLSLQCFLALANRAGTPQGEPPEWWAK